MNGSNLISYSYGGGTANVPTRELQLPLALAELIGNIERVGKASEELGLRLEKVLQPEPPAPGVNSKDPQPPQAEYVRELQEQSQRLRRISENLESVIHRLEL